MKAYLPELGQAVFGAPWGEYDCPRLLLAALEHLQMELSPDPDTPDPFGNTGSAYSNDTFSVRAYYWGDDEAKAALPNFTFGDIEVRWYKQLCRGTTVNREVTPQEISDLLDCCLRSLTREK